MTDSEINVAIAEACGWTRNSVTGHWRKPVDYFYEQANCPDYCADLNAMHEAETFALKTAGDALAYARALLSVVGATSDSGDIGLWDVWKVSKASPHDRAEAFLRALNLWKE